MKMRLKDVADRLGLSKATVSLALNGSDRINIETRRRVEKVAQEMGYTPNPHARKLATKKSKQIGLIIPDIENVYYASLVRHVSDALNAYGYDLMISTSENSCDRERKLVQAMINNRMEGLILAPVNTPNHDLEYLASLEDPGIPTVFSTSKYAGVKQFCVMSDLYGGMQKVVRDIYNKGYRRIMMLSGPEGVYCLELRVQGYLETIRELNLDYEKICCIDEVTYDQALNLMEKTACTDCDAVVCVNDMVALGVVNALLEKGFKVPGDIAVAGYDDVIFSQISTVPITTVRQEIKQMAVESVEMVLDIIQGKLDKSQPVKRSIPCELVFRQSS